MEKSRRSRFYSVSATTTSDYRPRAWNGDAEEINVQYSSGLESSLSTTRVRQRLFDLMGTDVIRLNDKRYFQKLSKRLQDEYETHMDKQEEARCAAEEQRIRRLMLDGIINKPTDYRAVVHSEHANKPAKKKKKRKSKKRMADGFSTFTSEDTNFGLPRHSEKEKYEKDLVTQVSIMSGARPGSSRPSYKPKRHSFASPQSSPRPSKGYSSEKENLEESGEEEEGFDSVSLPGPTQTRPPSKYSRHEPELIKTLRKEETVAGLYSLAEELISPVKAEDVVGNRKSRKTY